MMHAGAGSSNSTDTNMEIAYNSVRVEFSDDNFEEGLYSCTIQDNKHEHQFLTVGVFRSGKYIMLTNKKCSAEISVRCG